MTGVALQLASQQFSPSARDDEQRDEVARQAGLVAQSASPDLPQDDIASVKDMQARVHQALTGDVPAAYRDHAGETRST